MGPAVDKVLAIPELLEEILLNLPLRRLLLSQRVDKNFKDVIHGSFRIRKALWLEPSTSDVIKWHPEADPRGWRRPFTGSWRRYANDGFVEPIINPFFVYIDRFYCPTDSHSPKFEVGLINPSHPIIQRFSRFKQFDLHDSQAVGHIGRRFICDHSEYDCKDIALDGDLCTDKNGLAEHWNNTLFPADGNGSSCLKMLVTHPPIGSVEVRGDRLLAACSLDVIVAEEDKGLVGVRVRRFVQAAKEISIDQRAAAGEYGWFEGKTNTFEVMGGEYWRFLEGSPYEKLHRAVDDITGHEMLALLNMKVEDIPWDSDRGD